MERETIWTDYALWTDVSIFEIAILKQMSHFDVCKSDNNHENYAT